MPIALSALHFCEQCKALQFRVMRHGQSPENGAIIFLIRYVKAADVSDADCHRHARSILLFEGVAGMMLPSLMGSKGNLGQ